MKRIDIKGGYTCNNNCLFCILGDKRSKVKDRTTKEIFKEIKKAANKGFDKIVLTGGEITIRKDFIKLLRYAREQKFKIIHVESNGKMFVYEDFVKKMLDNGANSFTVSLHASTAQDYAYITRSDIKSFGYVIRGLKNLKKFTNKISINCTINKVNYKKLTEIIGLCQKIGIESLNFNFLNVCGNANENKEKIMVNYQEVAPYLRKALEFAKENNISITTEMIPLCYLTGFEESCVELYDKKMEINALDYEETDFMKSIKEGRIKSEICSRCKYDRICFGILDDEQREINLKNLTPLSGRKIISVNPFLKKKIL